MPEIGSSGLMSGDGKRGVGHRPQATAPILASTKCDIELIANFHYAQQVDEKSRKIFQDFVLPGSRPKGIL
jgi:hypothetical protein